MAFTFAINGHTYTSDPANTGVPAAYHFDGYNYLVALGNLALDLVAVATQVLSDKTAAAASATAAAASAASAAAIAGGFVGTSATSWIPAIGTQAFTTQSGEQYGSGMFVTVVSAANGANFGYGQIASYAGTTLTVDVQVIGGSGTHTDWNISISGVRGEQGAPGTLSGNATGAISMVDQQFSRALLIDCGYVFINKGNSGTSTQTLDYTAGSHQKITATGNHTITTSNWPPSGNMGEMLLELTNGAAFTITWPTVNWVKPDGTVTTTFSSNGVNLQSSGTDFAVLWTRDAGATIYGKWIR